jgi:hypothetical protein
MLFLALALGPAAAMAGQAPAPMPGDSVAWATVTYLSGAAVYVEVGTRQGVREGTLFTVVRGGLPVAELTARYVSSTRASCTVTSGTTTLVVGDSVRFVPVLAAAPPAQVTSGPVTGAPSGRRGIPLRGRVGVRYLIIDQPGGARLTQPSLDLRLDGVDLGHSGFGLAVDVRTQRTSLSSGTLSARSPANLTRVYQANMNYQGGGGRTRLSAGRQFATALAPLGIFDGLALDMHHDHWSAGVLAGTQPDAVTFDPSGANTEYGAWVQRHNAPGSGLPWSATVGAVGSYDHGQINREFGYLRVTVSSPRFSIYAAQELDLNRGWKREVEGAAVTMTSSFATGQLNLSRAVALSGGFDSRRSVRLYRDFENPESQFDDAFRQGSWGGLALRFSSRVRLMTTARTSGGGAAGRAQSLTGSLLASRLTPLQLGLRLRASRYTGPTSQGLLGSVALEASPVRAVRLSVNAGQRTSEPPDGSAPLARLSWTGVDVDVALGRSLYILLSTYREAGTPSASTQSYGSVSWRF